MIDIFIRTYEKDLEWLKYCLMSIHKFLSGYRNIIVCIPENQIHYLNDFNLPNVVTAPIYKNDYIGQQISKLQCYRHSDAEYILYIDSDVCFYKPTNVHDEFFKDGKPIVFKTPYEFVGVAKCWKAPTEKILKKEVNYEYMRRLPIIYRRDTIENLNKDIEYEKQAVEINVFSEFNLLGAYSEINETEKYFFWDTYDNKNLPVQCIIQHWSWGGLTNNIRNELETILK